MTGEEVAALAVVRETHSLVWASFNAQGLFFWKEVCGYGNILHCQAAPPSNSNDSCRAPEGPRSDLTMSESSNNRISDNPAYDYTVQ